MKKILSIFGMIFLSSAIYAQAGLDTVFLRFPVLKGEEFWWGIDGINPKQLDSLQKQQYKKLVRYLDDQNPGSGTNVTYDSLPGWIAMSFYFDYWSHPEARENMGQGIDTKFKAAANLTPYTSAADTQRLARFNKRKNSGRDTTQ